MSRIFFSLALFATLLLVTTIVLGLNIGDFNVAHQNAIQRTNEILQDTKDADIADAERDAEEAQIKIAELSSGLVPITKRKSVHFLTAVLAAIVTVLVNCIAVTYFVGTSRWCKEVVAAYSLDDQYVQRSVAIKRRSFVWSLLGVSTIMGIIALGAASDPATLRANTAAWVQPHMWSAFGGICLIATSFVSQMLKIQDHSSVVEEILVLVREIRIERGLDVE